MMTAIPIYPNVAPYTQIPTQYSIHKCSELGKCAHLKYLVPDPRIDSRRDLVERLIDDLEEEGSIIVYSGFEKFIIDGLKEVFTELSTNLDSLLNRLVDLQKLIKENFYLPEFHGSLSIKNVLPSLVPNMTYDDLCNDPLRYVVSMSLWEMNQLTDIKPKNAVWIKSSCDAFCDEMKIDEERKNNWLAHFNIKKYSTHASGHASGEEIKEMIATINPDILIPIHTEKSNFFNN